MNSGIRSLQVGARLYRRCVRDRGGKNRTRTGNVQTGEALHDVQQMQQERVPGDPPQRPRPPLRHHPPRGDAHGLRPSAAGFVGGRVRRARSAPLRVGAALRPAAPPGDRADSGMGARRDQDVSGPRGGRPCHGCGKRVERSRSARRICCRPGGSRGACRRARARCCGLRDQGRTCGRPGCEGESAGRLECRWQREQLPDAIRELVLEDQRLRNEICWSVFD